MKVLKLMIIISLLQTAYANPLPFMSRSLVNNFEKISLGSKIFFNGKTNVFGTLLNLRSVEFDKTGFLMTFLDDRDFKRFINDYNPSMVVSNLGDVVLKINSTDSDVIKSEVEKLVDAYRIFLHQEKVLQSVQGEFIEIITAFLKKQQNFMPRLVQADFTFSTSFHIAFEYDTQFMRYLSSLKNENVVVKDQNKTTILLTLYGPFQVISDNLVTVVFGFKEYLKNRVR